MSEDSHVWICSATRFVPEAGTVGEKGIMGDWGRGFDHKEQLTIACVSSNTNCRVSTQQAHPGHPSGCLPPYLP